MFYPGCKASCGKLDRSVIKDVIQMKNVPYLNYFKARLAIILVLWGVQLGTK